MSTRHIDQALRLAGRLHAVDETRVFLIGHSLGAGQVMARATAAPARYAAIAPISGGFLGGLASSLKDLPTFSARGAEDLLGGARRGATSRPESRSDMHVDRVYPDVEHIMIMHECLDDVMKFFDRVAAR